MNMNPVRLAVLSVLLLGTAAFRHPPASRVAIRSSAIRPKSPSELDLGRRPNDVGDDSGTCPNLSATRRSFARSLACVVTAAASLPSDPPARAARESAALTPYEDGDYGFRLKVPSSWEHTEQTLSGRRKGVFFTDPSSKDATTGAIETFGVIAYTQVRDDFTSLSSFGSVDEVAQATIMPKGSLAGQSDASRMLSAASKNGAYYFDYVATPQVPTAPGSGSVLTTELKQQHFRTIFTLLPLKVKNAAGMTLVTITLQTTEERYGGIKGLLDEVMNSFGKIPS